MGSFNVACSISSLSIGAGDPVAFFPLLPSYLKYYSHKEKDHLVGRHHMLIYTNCFFNPLCLPIFGTYNDYGGIEDIEEDSNTKALEQFFGLPIHDIVAALTCGRGPVDKYSEIFRVEAKHKHLFDYNVSFDEAWLTEMGFVESPHPLAEGQCKYFRFRDYPYWVTLETTTRKYPDNEKIIEHVENGFILWDERLACVTKEFGYNAPDRLLETFHQKTGYYIHIDEKAQERVDLLQNLSGMFVHREIYNALSHSPIDRWGKDKKVADNHASEDVLRSFGFQLVPPEEQLCIDPHHPKIYRKSGVPFDVKWGAFGLSIVHQRHKEYYVFGDVKTFDVQQVKRRWGDITGTDAANTFPEPKNMKSVTQPERAAIFERFNELTGATLTWAPSGEDVNHHIYSLRKFVKVWEKFTGEKLDISQHQRKSQYHLEFEKLQQDLIEFAARKPEIRVYKYPSIEKQRELYEARANLKKLTQTEETSQPFEPKPEGEEYQEIEDMSWHDPLSYWRRSSSESFAMRFQDWKYFDKIYRQPIMVGNEDLKQAFEDYILFHVSMYGCNRFFFPAMNGEQCGNPDESRHLLMATLRVLDQDSADRLEYTLEDIAFTEKYD